MHKSERSFRTAKWEWHWLAWSRGSWSPEATHEGEIVGIRAAGERISMTGMVFSRAANEKIDVPGILQQPGVSGTHRHPG